MRVEAGTDEDLGHLPYGPSSNGTKLFLLQHQAARPVWSKTHGYLGVTLCCVQHQSQGLQQQLLQLLPVLEAVLCRGIEQMWVCLAPRGGYSLPTQQQGGLETAQLASTGRRACLTRVK